MFLAVASHHAVWVEEIWHLRMTDHLGMKPLSRPVNTGKAKYEWWKCFQQINKEREKKSGRQAINRKAAGSLNLRVCNLKGEARDGASVRQREGCVVSLCTMRDMEVRKNKPSISETEYKKIYIKKENCVHGKYLENQLHHIIQRA